MIDIKITGAGIATVKSADIISSREGQRQLAALRKLRIKQEQ